MCPNHVTPLLPFVLLAVCDASTISPIVRRQEPHIDHYVISPEGVGHHMSSYHHMEPADLESNDKNEPQLEPSTHHYVISPAGVVQHMSNDHHAKSVDLESTDKHEPQLVQLDHIDLTGLYIPKEHRGTNTLADVVVKRGDHAGQFFATSSSYGAMTLEVGGSADDVKVTLKNGTWSTHSLNVQHDKSGKVTEIQWASNWDWIAKVSLVAQNTDFKS
eukprot:gnl/TRDRNA2_/TRDRNA2_81716_c0_seq1.p1 gnl/TRDRNA2_/TRDRNA2_81716_c0~~gnl/TRDRNA2_/TRDRNA2_81716_c0_seq1.p1  ORF type:complete len:217 (+),score=16.71 gnl/TRDRNA2_/TRDRNA2_81716_c0_seq1:112-762(+)